ncbi:HAD family hydrolase [Brevibacillus ginsengisoli]|uniref:HAD family hydrolase n=1 Tax=Brevibacillus ginsengisoli TaxID=363854 RepID=UPI003CEE5F4A
MNYDISGVILDLDGTLLNSKKEVTPRNMEAVMNCYEKGVPIIIATARPPRSVKQLVPEELLKLGVIVYYNGALIVNEEQQIREHFPIESTLLSDLVKCIMELENDPHLSIEVEDRWYSNKNLDYQVTMKVTENPEIIDFDQIQLLHASKVLITNFKSAQALFNQFNEQLNIISTDQGELIQIMSKKASKEYAVQRVCRHLNIPIQNVMAFGDDFNDLGLFEISGYPIAMGNAIDELKALAKEVTATNDNDGVALVLEKLL